ncbi:aminotransferase class V-fold PLP-dependent enzyme [Nocardia cyriacigeorgica]|uniref:Aminotransferase class V-fold PLP-dependent enzyme n=1 Tax=Nocardia cyriacigeorgica TaxID=135487 RepID=A0A6P1D0X8_9NOCA|nr:aminotransferase class V-fold PLP-dependent enzyme [Nocardia cyriacigeorgica]NEW38032.1 aminotransferase class V-fold PLP-dependent enzyme [Nocardia cyriacigeorgica]NEW42940.1 aminotransferase class V-fold PLP-dependent enzyme [Nocardia cyriacigeorgica]
MNSSRRGLLAGLGAGAGVLAAGLVYADRPRSDPPAPAIIAAPVGRTPEDLADDEKFWAAVANQFPRTPRITNLENGYYGIMSAPVRQAYLANTERLNESSSYLLRTTYKTELEDIRKKLAATAGAAVDEIALTRGGTEALQSLITGYNKLRPGDAVMYADLDYHSCQYAVDSLRGRRGVEIVTTTVPEPATHRSVLDHYSAALREHPRVKLMLLSHMNNRTGLVLPVREIVAMARQQGVDVIVDVAHSWGQLDFTIDDLGADFIGFSLHKWINAPLGTGFLYIRNQRLNDIDTAFGDQSYPADDIRARVHSGTVNAAAFLTITTALDAHSALGAPVKQARLQYLRDYWVQRVRDIPAVEILTPQDRAMYGAITSFRIRRRVSRADNEAIAEYLRHERGIFTVRRGGVARGDCVRVTPAQFTSVEDVDRLAVALPDVVRTFG